MIQLCLALALGNFEPEPLLPGKPWVLRGHTDAIIAIAFSPDGQQLASASRDKSVKVWNLNNGEVVRTILGAHAEQLSSLAFSSDGRLLAVGDVGLQVQVIDLSTGKVFRALAHPDAVGEVALSPDGALIAVAGLSDTGAAYSLAEGSKKFEFRGRTARFSADGKMLLVSSGAGSFSLLDGKTGRVKKTVSTSPGPPPLTTMTPDGKVIASWTADGLDVKLWSSTGRSLGRLDGPPAEPEGRKARVTGVGLTPDGKRAVVGGGDGVVRLWSVGKNPNSPGAQRIEQVWPADRCSAVAVSSDGSWFAVADSGLIKLWKLP